MKNGIYKLAAMILGMALLTSCAQYTPGPLVFGQTDIYGVSIGGSAAEQGADFSLGYKGVSIAVIPVLTPAGQLVTAQHDAGDTQDTFSVLGQFESSNSGTGQSPNVNLGRFFATGFAAQALAEGFSEAMDD